MSNRRNSKGYDGGSSPYAWVEVQFGDDQGETIVVRDSDTRVRARHAR